MYLHEMVKIIGLDVARKQGDLSVVVEIDKDNN